MAIEVIISLGKKIIGRQILSKQQITMGRGKYNDIILPDRFVSREHAIIETEGDKWFILDRSVNGILLNNERITGRTPLPQLFKIDIYPFRLQCQIYNDESTEPISHLIKGEDTPSQFTIDQTLPSTEGITHHFGLLVGEHESLQEVYYLIEKLSNNNASVIIRGESGTGKDLVARAIHQNSQRGVCPYITINCAAIPENLIESELFGHEKGAFTGAYSRKKGKIEEAHTGTLFLDEIGELSPMAQAKLLRFLQEKTFARVGATKEMRVDARIIAATNKDIEEAIQEKRFRVDLYFRLRVVQIELSPLRERATDIPVLIQYFLKKISEEYHLDQMPTLTPQAMNRLIHYQWPGNVRQLENSLHSAFITAGDPQFLDEDNFDLDRDSLSSFSQDLSIKTRSLPSFDELSKEGLIKALEQCNWDTKAAARLLKVSRGTIYYKMKKFHIHPGHGKSSL